jgi:Mrp family chromosome partitioning ATPase
MEFGGSSQPTGASEPEPVTPRPAEHVVVVASGKGGVGKSTVSLNLALALSKGERSGYSTPTCTRRTSR